MYGIQDVSCLSPGTESKDTMATSAIDRQSEHPRSVVVIKKHHILVRLSHWFNIPLLLGLGLSGLSIYWAAPVYTHTPDSVTGNNDYLADIGIAICRHIPWLHHYASPDTWVYDHFSLGTGDLAVALNLHWLFAYLFMANGVLYGIGLLLGKGYTSLLPRRTDLMEIFLMVRYYIGLLPSKLLRRPWHHPVINSKYNALQRSAYFSMPIVGTLSILTGWAIHKPTQLGWLAALFGGYDGARIWHFWLMWAYVLFVIPHVVLVAADGWDTFRSMVVGWSVRIRNEEH
jgi:thiosulfate reductase cytochrome b subunit